MTESQIQNDLFLYWGRKRGGKKAKLMVDNVFLFPWESDFVVFNQSGLFVEYEIKVNKYDYFADYKKHDRHKCLSGKIECLRPNKFFFVVPFGLIEEKDVPSYAGLMWYFPEERSYPKRFVEVKPAPFLHRTKLNLFKELAVKLMFKYLNCRKK